MFCHFCMYLFSSLFNILLVFVTIFLTFKHSAGLHTVDSCCPHMPYCFPSGSSCRLNTHSLRLLLDRRQKYLRPHTGSGWQKIVGLLPPVEGCSSFLPVSPAVSFCFVLKGNRGR